MHSLRYIRSKKSRKILKKGRSRSKSRSRSLTGGSKVKLVSFSKSDRSGKKYMVRLQTLGGKTKTIHFGDSTMRDYTSFSPQEKSKHKSAYLSRHAKRENWNDPTTAGFWSRWILWGNTSNIKSNLASTRRRFNL
jgi:transposase-like protein